MTSMKLCDNLVHAKMSKFFKMLHEWTQSRLFESSFFFFLEKESYWLMTTKADKKTPKAD